MICVGITGPIGHGKTLFADLLAQQEASGRRIESSELIMAVANSLQAALVLPPASDDLPNINRWLQALPQIIAEVTHTTCTFADIEITSEAVRAAPTEYQKLFAYLTLASQNPQLLQTKITTKTKEEFRPFLQWLGGYLVAKVTPGIWYHEISRMCQSYETAGCRLCVVGGLRYPGDADILRTNGGVIIEVIRRTEIRLDVMDPTERDRGNIVPDVIVENNGNTDELRLCAMRIWEDLRSMALKTEYRAHTKS